MIEKLTKTTICALAVLLVGMLMLGALAVADLATTESLLMMATTPLPFMAKIAHWTKAVEALPSIDRWMEEDGTVNHYQRFCWFDWAQRAVAPMQFDSDRKEAMIMMRIEFFHHQLPNLALHFCAHAANLRMVANNIATVGIENFERRTTLAQQMGAIGIFRAFSRRRKAYLISSKAIAAVKKVEEMAVEAEALILGIMHLVPQNFDARSLSEVECEKALTTTRSLLGINRHCYEKAYEIYQYQHQLSLLASTLPQDKNATGNERLPAEQAQILRDNFMESFDIDKGI